MDAEAGSAGLRDELDVARGGGARWRCPHDLRARVVAYARGEISERGRRLEAIAGELGLSASGLGRWLKRDRREEGARLRPVRVVAGETASLVLVTPQGYRVEGLSVSAAVSLLRAL